VVEVRARSGGRQKETASAVGEARITPRRTSTPRSADARFRLCLANTTQLRANVRLWDLDAPFCQPCQAATGTLAAHQ